MLRKFLIVCFFVLYVSSTYAEEVVFESPWVREAPPNAKALAGYVVVKNSGATVQELVSASSPDFERVEFHVTKFDGGMMRMVHLKNVKLEPGEAMEFEPGGRHLMLVNPRKRLKAGDIVLITVGLKSGKQQNIKMVVRR